MALLQLQSNGQDGEQGQDSRGLSRFAISIPGFPKLPFLVWQCRSVNTGPPTSYWGTRLYYREPGQSPLVPTGCIPIVHLAVP